jgi:hypothetical protein
VVEEIHGLGPPQNETWRVLSTIPVKALVVSWRDVVRRSLRKGNTVARSKLDVFSNIAKKQPITVKIGRIYPTLQPIISAKAIFSREMNRATDSDSGGDQGPSRHIDESFIPTESESRETEINRTSDWGAIGLSLFLTPDELEKQGIDPETTDKVIVRIKNGFLLIDSE